MSLFSRHRPSLPCRLLALWVLLAGSGMLFAQQPDTAKRKTNPLLPLLVRDSTKPTIEDQYIIAELEKIQYANDNKNLKQAALRKELEYQRLKTATLEQQLVAQRLKTEVAHKQEIQQNQIKQLKIDRLNQQVLLDKSTRNSLIGLAFFLILLVVASFWYNQRLVRKNREIREATLKGQQIERRRVAADLHDNLGGMMSAIRLTIEAMDHAKFNPKEKEVYQNVLSMTRQAYNEIRLLSHNLQPEELEKFGLTEALQRLMDKLNYSQRICFSLIMNPLGKLSKDMEFNLYSISLELSSNIIKHSGATEASFEFVSKQDKLQVFVTDNGKGFIANNTSDGMGMRNIQERTEQMGGTLKVHSQPDEGTMFQFNIPLSPLAHVSRQT